MSSEGPLFPGKSQTGEPEEEAQPIEIERSDDPNIGKTTRRGRTGLPTMQGKKVGCSSGVFLLLLGIGMVALAATRVLL